MSKNSLNDVIGSTYQEVYAYKVGGSSEANREWSSVWLQQGMPTGGTFYGDISGRAMFMSDTGAIQYVNSTGSTYQYISYFGQMVNLPVSAFNGTSPTILIDRLWQNTGISVTTTTAQTINSAAFPSRDLYGTASGYSVYVGLEVTTPTTQAGVVTTITMEYTNEMGVGTRTGRIRSFPATATGGVFSLFDLQTSDNGVSSIQTLTLGTTLSAGAVSLVAYRPILCHFPMLGGSPTDVYTAGFSKLYNNSCLSWIQAGSSAASPRVATIRLFE